MVMDDDAQSEKLLLGVAGGDKIKFKLIQKIQIFISINLYY